MIPKRLLLIACSILFTAPCYSSEFDVDSLQEGILETIDRVQPAVVSIRGGGSFFSGVIVSSDGHVLSAGHAVRPGSRYQIILPNGDSVQGRGKGSNPAADCALIQITGKTDHLPFVPMGDSSNLVANQPCLSLSFPGGQGTRGVPVVRFGRVIRSGASQTLLQSSALMEPGDSGGALFDMDGRVIGIHSRIGRSMDRNYEVPINIFKEYWSELNQEKTFTEGGPPVPKLGFNGIPNEEKTGIRVRRVVVDSLAEEHGLQENDVINSIYGKNTKSIQDVRRALISARDEEATEIKVRLTRGNQGVELKIPFKVDRESAPKVELPKYEDSEFTKPTAISELANLPKQFASLEDRLDDACVVVTSKTGEDKKLSIIGTRIKESNLIVSKSSMVGDEPTLKIEDKEVSLEIIARDKANDVVILEAPESNAAGIELALDVEIPLTMGKFLITPDINGAGLISVLSTKLFESKKQVSRGFLGVVPSTYNKDQGAKLDQVTRGGAASKAGLKVGDIVTQLNDSRIKTQQDMRNFLSKLDPNVTVTATILRDEEELTKSITLGSLPSVSRHAADMMNKSARRDGFTKVIPHDADLKPEQCGGPIFDLDGNFVGLNIARNSRVRSYAIPREIIKELVDKNQK